MKKDILSLLLAVIFCGAAGYIYFFYIKTPQVSPHTQIKVTQQIKQKLQTPDTLFKEAKVVPRFNSANEIECMHMTEISKGSVFWDLALNEGDCFQLIRLFDQTENSGREFMLTDPALIFSLYSEIKNANKVELLLLRNNNKVEIHYLPE